LSTRHNLFGASQEFDLEWAEGNNVAYCTISIALSGLGHSQEADAVDTH